jgi:hypothetical protein
MLNMQQSVVVHGWSVQGDTIAKKLTRKSVVALLKKRSTKMSL